MEKNNILSQLVDYFKPKAHDAIDNITSAWEESKSRGVLSNRDPRLEEFLINMIEGGGGIGGAVKPLGKKALKKAALDREIGDAISRKFSFGQRRRGSGHPKRQFHAGDDIVDTMKKEEYKASQEGDFFKSLLDSMFD